MLMYARTVGPEIVIDGTPKLRIRLGPGKDPYTSNRPSVTPVHQKCARRGRKSGSPAAPVHLAR